MNIIDILAKEEPPQTQVGLLEDMFAMQARLEEKYAPIEHARGLRWIEQQTADLDDAKGQLQVKDQVFRIITELIEMTETLKNKPWKQTQMPTDKNHFYEELSDSFHFFLGLCLMVGLTPQDLFRIYFAKHQVNEFRITSNY